MDHQRIDFVMKMQNRLLFFIAYAFFPAIAWRKIPMYLREIRVSSSYGENNFGDIMGGCETHVTVEGSLTPMERVVMTANGNLQRIMSAHYDAPVFVRVLKCDRMNSTTFGRHVDLVVNDRVFCTAIGTIELYSDECVQAIEEKNVGVGQLFRYLGVLPSFLLLKAGRETDGRLWREYELSCPQLRCRFVETFAPQFLEFTSSNPSSTAVERTIRMKEEAIPVLPSTTTVDTINK